MSFCRVSVARTRDDGVMSCHLVCSLSFCSESWHRHTHTHTYTHPPHTKTHTQTHTHTHAHTNTHLHTDTHTRTPPTHTHTHTHTHKHKHGRPVKTEEEYTYSNYPVLSNCLIPQSRVLLGKLTVAELLQKETPFKS